MVHTFAFGHAAAALDFFLTSVNGITWSMGITTKGSSCAATAAASPRVDVEKTPHAAAAAASTDVLTSAGHVWTEFGCQPGLGHNFQRVEEEGRSGGGKLDSFFVFVVSLDGSSVQVRVKGTDSYESLAVKIAAKVNIPLSLVSYLLRKRSAACSTPCLHASSRLFSSDVLEALGWCSSPTHSWRMVLSSM